MQVAVTAVEESERGACEGSSRTARIIHQVMLPFQDPLGRSLIEDLPALSRHPCAFSCCRKEHSLGGGFSCAPSFRRVEPPCCFAVSHTSHCCGSRSPHLVIVQRPHEWDLDQRPGLSVPSSSIALVAPEPTLCESKTEKKTKKTGGPD